MSISFRAIRRLPKRRLLFAVPRQHVENFEVLLDAWCKSAITVEVLPYDETMPTGISLAARCTQFDAVMLAGSARYAPSTALPGPFLQGGDGRRVPAAWLPVTDGTVRRFAAAARRVHERARQCTTVALLCQWHPRYLHLADRVESLLERAVHAFRWTGEVIGRDELVSALGAGVGLAVYVGEGRPIGWVGYRGLRAWHFDGFRGEPLGGIVSLCCHTASRRRTGVSYAEALPLLGVTAATFGAVRATLHTDNTRWAVGICETLASGVDTIGELIVRSAPPNKSASAAYRIIGDPLAPVAAENAAAKRARAIPTYP